MSREKNHWLIAAGLSARGEVRCGHAGCRQEVARVWRMPGWVLIEAQPQPTAEEIAADTADHVELLERAGVNWKGSRAVWPVRVRTLFAFAAPGAKPLTGGGLEGVKVSSMNDAIAIPLKCRDHPAFEITLGEVREIRRYPHFAM